MRYFVSMVWMRCWWREDDVLLQRLKRQVASRTVRKYIPTVRSAHRYAHVSSELR